MIETKQGHIIYEEEDFHDNAEWRRYQREENTPGATFRVKPDYYKNRTILK